MAKLYRSDLEKVNTYAAKALKDEVKDSAKLIASINNFVSGSTNLTGSAWNKERERMSSYINALEKRKKVSTALILAIKDANRVMEAYLDGFPWNSLKLIPNISVPKTSSINYVDDSWLGELNAALTKANNIYNTNYASTSDSDEVKQKKASTRSEQDAIIKACKAVIQYLEQLQPKAKEAYAKYATVSADLAALKALNHEVNENLFDHIGGRTHINTVYVGGGGYANNAGGTTNVTTNTPTAPAENPTTVTAPATNPPAADIPTENPTQVDNPAPTPVINVAPTVNPRPTVVTNPTQPRTTTKTPTATEPNIEVVPSNNEPSVTVVPRNVEEPTTVVDDVNPSIQTQTVRTVTRGDSTAKKVGLGILGAAALGGAAYGTYAAAKHIKENNQINDDDDDDSETLDYDDINNVDIKMGKDDI